jgi:hypothetical protein
VLELTGLKPKTRKKRLPVLGSAVNWFRRRR